MTNAPLTERQNEIIESAIETVGNNDPLFTPQWADEHHLSDAENSWLFAAVRMGLLLYFRQTPQQRLGATVELESTTRQ